ncbi:hypothetical protein M378DRAFT_160481 [Amanita muscaria Koide BX008]|uniref:Uncharacterized protein n=1 Tax=Amanita muscaria (strain Koide BX008) TaxID=946122 RepID=A0A0C2SU57_AMAMK|nr:hypothetical protein M378DRAFT_160481 [Amanita muscaria Koide BX008]
MLLDTQMYLILLILQAVLYILYLASLAHVLRWLLCEEGWPLKRRNKVNWGQLSFTLVVFVFTTADLVFTVADQLFIDELITQEQITIASISIESATLIITDAILVRYCKSLNAVELEI